MLPPFSYHMILHSNCRSYESPLLGIYINKILYDMSTIYWRIRLALYYLIEDIIQAKSRLRKSKIFKQSNSKKLSLRVPFTPRYTIATFNSTDTQQNTVFFHLVFLWTEAYRNSKQGHWCSLSIAITNINNVPPSKFINRTTISLHILWFRVVLTRELDYVRVTSSTGQVRMQLILS